MSFDDIPHGQFGGNLVSIAKLEESFEVAESCDRGEVGPWPGIYAVTDSAPQVVDVVRCDSIRESEDLGDTLRDSDLDRQRRIRQA